MRSDSSVQPTATARPRRRGAAAAEAAVLLPFLCLMFGAAVDFARVYATTQTLQTCAYAGALCASGTAQSSQSAGGPVVAATNAALADGVSLQPPLAAENVSVTIGTATATVTVSYDFLLLTSFLQPAAAVPLQRSVVVNLAPTPGN